jgi:hypothetical protein
MLSWGIHSTAVELVPSVFYFFQPDAPTLLTSPRSEVVIGDGGFYLESSPTQYDVIMIDPPPPVLASRLPPLAVTDLLEWGPRSTAEAQFGTVMSREISLTP